MFQCFVSVLRINASILLLNNLCLTKKFPASMTLDCCHVGRSVGSMMGACDHVHHTNTFRHNTSIRHVCDNWNWMFNEQRATEKMVNVIEQQRSLRSNRGSFLHYVRIAAMTLPCRHTCFTCVNPTDINLSIAAMVAEYIQSICKFRSINGWSTVMNRVRPHLIMKN